MSGPNDSEHGEIGARCVTISERRLALYKSALKRSMRRVAAYKRRLGRKAYALQLYDRMLIKRFNPEFLFPRDLPTGRRVLVVLPHHHEAAKIGGIVRVLLAPDERGEPGNNVHAVVVMPSHRSITTSANFAKREDMIDAVNKEGLHWAYVIGLCLGVTPWDFRSRLRNPVTDLPPETAYTRRRIGDQFVYGPDGAYRFFNAWRTYDSGEGDPNRQQVAPEDQCQFDALMREEDPDLVLLPDQMDPHPSHHTTRVITMDAMRTLLAERHAAGENKTITLLEYASFQLITPPRYNLWVMAPKEIACAKTEANKVFRLQKQHDYEMDQIMAERVVSMAAGDEFYFARSHPEKTGFATRLSRSAPGQLPANITAESFTVSLLSVVMKRGMPVVQEQRLTNIHRNFAGM